MILTKECDPNKVSATPMGIGCENNEVDKPAAVFASLDNTNIAGDYPTNAEMAAKLAAETAIIVYFSDGEIPRPDLVKKEGAATIRGNSIVKKITRRLTGKTEAVSNKAEEVFAKNNLIGEMYIWILDVKGRVIIGGKEGILTNFFVEPFAVNYDDGSSHTIEVVWEHDILRNDKIGAVDANNLLLINANAVADVTFVNPTGVSYTKVKADSFKNITGRVGSLANALFVKVLVDVDILSIHGSAAERDAGLNAVATVDFASIGFPVLFTTNTYGAILGGSLELNLNTAMVAGDKWDAIYS